MSAMAEEKQVELSGDQIAQMLAIEKANAREFKKQLSQLNAVVLEITAGIASLEQVEGKQEVQSMVPLGAGVWVEAKLIPETARIEVPGGILSKKTPAEIKEFLESQGNEVQKRIEEAKAKLAQSNTRIKEFNGIMGLAERSFRNQMKE